MICPNCKVFKAKQNPFCEECGTKTIEHNCECGNSLKSTQKYCEKCGRPCPPLKEAVKRFIWLENGHDRVDTQTH